MSALTRTTKSCWRCPWRLSGVALGMTLIVVAAGWLHRSVTAEAPAARPAGQPIADFTLPDSYGKPRSLKEIDSPLVVVAFLGTECPLAKLYAPRLQSLHEKYRERGVTFLAIDSNFQDSLTEIAAFARQQKWSFAFCKDLDQRVADQFGAVRTPEVFVLDRERRVRYHGRIDDQYGVGYQRPKNPREDLALAIDELLAGKEVTVAQTPAAGCHIGRVNKVAPQGEVTYSSHIAKIFNERCVECHRTGEIAPFPLTQYEHVQGWGDTIMEVIEENRMPPWSANPEFGHFRNDARLSADEKRLITTWVKNGMPQGDPAQQPPARTFAEGWRMPTPDLVIPMRDKPYVIKAEGTIDYQYFEVDPGFTEDKYVWAAEARPDNRAVVHHIIVYIKPPGVNDFRKAGSVDGYAPGSEPKIYHDGLAKLVPAGSKFVFEMHYTANGTEQLDRSVVGLKFLPKEQVKKIVVGGLAANGGFVIPPGADHHRVEAEQTIDRDLILLNLTPHMHVRGKSFRYEAKYPDGRHEVLLDVPRYDFNWQLTYELAEPKRIPRGTVIHCTAAFDNSDGNPANPDPTKEVRWGNQSWEEMMIGFFDVIPNE